MVNKCPKTCSGADFGMKKKRRGDRLGHCVEELFIFFNTSFLLCHFKSNFLVFLIMAIRVLAVKYHFVLTTIQRGCLPNYCLVNLSHNIKTKLLLLLEFLNFAFWIH
uniref:Transmembrane protein n=1 Tax=Pyxicephalus adspersus TaxID=30357 RepID=A0AAV3AGK5_PYXAD|nr:TPA: hypothetical protein GDO54_011066 [Pyxicephalus adspersus]